MRQGNILNRFGRTIFRATRRILPLNELMSQKLLDEFWNDRSFAFFLQLNDLDANLVVSGSVVHVWPSAACHMTPCCRGEKGPFATVAPDRRRSFASARAICLLRYHLLFHKFKLFIITVGT